MSMMKEILIVEDNELNREILSSILSDTYEVLQAENGQVALDLLSEHRENVSLILLDVMMPLMDGYTFLDRIKEDPELSMIPVIVMTQSNSESDELVALAHGATDFVPKPYRPQVILHRVAALIKLRETAALVNYLQYDRLTGLYCKEYFYKRVHELLMEDPEGSYCIFCANIEGFKLVNEIYGAANGELLVKAVARMTRDMIGEHGFCARMETDRFICLYKGENGVSNREALRRMSEQAYAMLPKRVIIRCGMYEINDRTISAEQMCDRAMLAADKIKKQYNRYFSVYDDNIRSEMLHEQEITSAMEYALNENQFVVHLQPKFSLIGNCIAGAEALVRWVHPEWGFIPPGEFIPLFEKTGFIAKLDQYVWEQACRYLRDWKVKGYPLVPISVNVSRVDVFHLDVAETVTALTKKYGIDPSYLHIEITESAYGEFPEHVIASVNKLRKHGFIVEMDDFGSGYSSLSMLSRISLDILKLDMQFTQNELAKPEDESFLIDVVRLAHRLRLGVVAEGVETGEQMKRLREMGCDYVQGFYFSKPLPIDEFEKHLPEWQQKDDSTDRAQEDIVKENAILVVDEDERFCQMVRDTFKDQYSVLAAYTEQEALRCIRSGSKQIGAVMLSLSLPGKGAERIMNKLRQMPALWKIPVMATIPRGDCESEIPLAQAADDFMCKHHPIFDMRKRVTRMMDTAAVYQKMSVLQDEACHDPLTGLLNRRGFQDAMCALRNDDMPLTVYIFDMDDLKRANEAFGHPVGDRILKCFAEQMCRLTRSEDIKCRYGGDEFLAVLKHVGSQDMAMRKGEAICRAFCDSVRREGFEVTCSAGVAVSEPDKNSSELFARAEQALLRAKQETKGCCCLWKPAEA